MEVILAILIYMGVITATDEYQEGMDNEYEAQIEEIQSDDELMEEEIDPIIVSIDDREQ